VTHIDFDQLDRLRDGGHAAFIGAKPYPHLVIEGFLREASFREVVASLPPPVEGQRSSDYVFAKNKFENPAFDGSARVLAELRDELTSRQFADFLTVVYGKSVFIDDYFVGGGLHQGGAGSFLDMHADFSRHPVQREWVRELNILLYLNDGYQEAWGGHLEMQHGETGEIGRVAPSANRAVIMLTKEHTLHGYKPISFPPGRYRTSLASYAYSHDADFSAVPDRTTLWRPQEGGFVKRLVAQVAPFAVRLKRAMLGSSTAKRAERSPDSEGKRN
jgi:hypothetical protein